MSTTPPEVALLAYIHKSLASARGLTPEETPQLVSTARVAELAVLDWITVHAPDAVPTLRRAGLIIWSHEDGFGV